jgi:hypothetical protein
MPKSILVFVFLVACGPFGPDKSGDNGEGDFRYVCAAATDPTCQGAIVEQTFPTQIALGAVFGVSFSATSSTATTAVVQSAATALLHFENGKFRAAEAGYAGLVALNTDGRVVDFTHVLIAAPAGFAILRDATTPALAVMTTGASQTVFASPLDGDGFAIAGAVPATWSVSDATVLELVETSPAVAMTINAKAVGQTTLTVSAGGVSQDVAITVEEAL